MEQSEKDYFMEKFYKKDEEDFNDSEEGKPWIN